MKVVFPKRMSKKTAIELSIKHWQRMIRWAKKQNPRERASHRMMRNLLKEAPYTGCCSLCKKYDCSWDTECNKCPLYLSNNECKDDNSIYLRVCDSKTWKTWIKNANKMLKILKELK